MRVRSGSEATTARRRRRGTGGLAIAAAGACAFAVALGAEVSPVGLSPVRALRFVSGFGSAYPAEVGEHFGSAFAVGDLNGDGVDDLVTGLPEDDGALVFGLDDSGLVVLRYGAALSGLGTNLDVLARDAFADAEAFDYFGFALAVCDFDGDGVDDLAIGAPGETLGALAEAGAVYVFYPASELGSQAISEQTAGVPDEIEEADYFGYALACGDFDLDGRADLAIGVPRETVGPQDLLAGAVVVVPGSAAGLDPGEALMLHEDNPDIDDAAEFGDRLGAALAAGDFDGDGFADLAIGAPGESFDRGALHVLFGSESGLGASREICRDESGIGGLSEDGDRFAQSLAVGDFDADGGDDLAIGIPWEDLGAGNSIHDCGQVNVIFGAVAGFDFNRNQFWSQDNIFGPTTTEAGDRFGESLAAGDFDDDGKDDLAIGSPREFVTGADDGALSVIAGSDSGLTNERRSAFAAGFDGVPGNAALHGKSFSYALGAGDFDADGHADLAIGAPFENVGGLVNSGTVTLLRGSLFADGFETGGMDLWSPTLPRNNHQPRRP